MKHSRLLGIGFLIGAIVLGFTQQLQLEKISGAITSYSTMTSLSTLTSTSYSYVYPTTSTILTTATSTTDRLTQTSPDGPYLSVTGKWNIFIEGQIEFDIIVKNLINVNIQSGVAQFGVQGLIVRRDDIEVNFGAIRPGESINVKQVIGLPGVKVGEKVTPLSARAILTQKESIVIVTPLETVTRTGTLTETYRKTIVSTYTVTSAYTIEEPPASGNMQLMLVLGLVAVAAIVGVAFMKTRKGPAAPKPQEAKPQPQVETAPKPVSPPTPEVKAVQRTVPPARPVVKGVKYCIHCGATIPDVVSFCTKCGKKQQN